MGFGQDVLGPKLVGMFWGRGQNPSGACTTARIYQNRGNGACARGRARQTEPINTQIRNGHRRSRMSFELNERLRDGVTFDSISDSELYEVDMGPPAEEANQVINVEDSRLDSEPDEVDMGPPAKRRPETVDDVNNFSRFAKVEGGNREATVTFNGVPYLMIKDAGMGKGSGLFALQEIPEGAPVISYVDADTKPIKSDEKPDYLLHKQYIYDGEIDSDGLNVFWDGENTVGGKVNQAIPADTENVKFVRAEYAQDPPYFVAIRTIHANEELLADYGWPEEKQMEMFGRLTDATDESQDSDGDAARVGWFGGDEHGSPSEGGALWYHTKPERIEEEAAREMEAELSEWKAAHERYRDGELGLMVVLYRTICQMLVKLAVEKGVHETPAIKMAMNKARDLMDEFYVPKRPFSETDPAEQTEFRARLRAVKEMAVKAHQILDRFADAVGHIPPIAKALIQEFHDESSAYAPPPGDIVTDTDTVAAKLEAIKQEGITDPKAVLGLVKRTRSYPIRLEDLETLRSGIWLNDTVVNAMLELVCSPNLLLVDGAVDTDAITLPSSFFVNFIDKGGYKAVKRWSKKYTDRIFGKTHVLIPANMNGNHWILTVVDMSTKQIQIYNSIEIEKPSEYNIYFETLRSYIVGEYGGTFDFSGWTNVVMRTPKQKNGFDCGVYTIGFAAFRFYKEGFLDLEHGSSDENRRRIYDALLAGRLSPQQALFYNHTVPDSGPKRPGGSDQQPEQKRRAVSPAPAPASDAGQKK